jgi:hypothetical protein
MKVQKSESIPVRLSSNPTAWMMSGSVAIGLGSTG